MDMYPDMGRMEERDGAMDQGGKKPMRDEEGGETALLPKSLCPDMEFEPGQELKLKVVHVYDDEVEVEYMKEGEEDKGRGHKSEMEQAGDRMGAMAGGDDGM